MKKLLILVLFVLISVVSATSVLAKNENSNSRTSKINICHYEYSTGLFRLINVSENSKPAHLKHGDGLPGGLVPFMGNNIFTDDCSIVTISGIERYWVGGTGNWNETTHWSYTSGGRGGATVPSIDNDVIIDKNSGFRSGGRITLNNLFYFHNFTSNSGHNYTIYDSSDNGSFVIGGSAIFEAGITFVNVSEFSSITFNSTDASETITSNGSLLSSVYFLGTGKWTLQDDLISKGKFYIDNGTFDANDHNVTAGDYYFYADTDLTPTIIMGSGTWDVTTEGVGWIVDEVNSNLVSFVPETSTIKLTGGNQEFSSYGSDKYYNSVWFDVGTGNSTHGNITLNILKISAGVGINFEAGKTITLNKFTAIGTSENKITLNTSGPGQFNLSKSSGIVVCDYLDLSNSNATGGAIWYPGSNSIDTINNSGWLFSDSPNRYWVGGSGNWSDDDNHWAKVSGGAPADGNLPTPLNNVYFDSNSGVGTVNLNVSGNCNDLDFSETSLLGVSGTGQLNIYGNFIAKSGMTFTNTSAFLFLAQTLGHTITTNSNSFTGRFVFDGEGGEWILQDDLTILESIQHNKGTLDFNGVNLNLNNFFSSSFTPRTLLMRDSVLILSQGSNIAFSTQRSNGPLTLDAGTSKVILTGDGAKVRPGKNTLYDIEFQNNGQIDPDDIITSWGCNNLTVAPGKTVKFPANKITNVVGTFTANGSPGNLIFLRSTTENIKWTISATNTNISYVDVMDSIATGGGFPIDNIDVVNSVNSTGWITP